MHAFLGITLETLVILALVAANGFFVAAEFALVKVRASQLRPLARQGGWRIKLALRATEHLDAALSATQLGITLASLGLGWLGEPFLAHRLEPLLAHWGITNPATVQSVCFAVAFAVITFLHIVFGELAPKSLAIQRAKGVTLWTAGPLLGFYYLFFPFIWLLNGTANRFLRWVGLGPTGEGEHGFSADELEYVFSHARHTHPADALVNRLMVQSLRVRSTHAAQIMLPRDQVTILRQDAPLRETLRTAQTSGHSRFPVVGPDDEVKGILLIREWLWQLQALGPDAPFAPLLRPALAFGLKSSLPEMIERFRQSRMHLAVVLDEQGRFAGIVTLEDVLEEIVGDIRDETDIGRGPIHEHTERAVVASGALTMRELQAETGWSFEWLPRETVAGWFLRHTGRAPRLNETVAIGEYRLTALEIQEERLRRIRIERQAEPAP
ncbi:MAG: HlyC/CorC family transporter [Verrucomicrobia bacterium]|nr:HlyC/CorC family transporter [Verrucomicrobiota bacterium]